MQAWSSPMFDGLVCATGKLERLRDFLGLDLQARWAWKANHQAGNKLRGVVVCVLAFALVVVAWRSIGDWCGIMS